MNALDTTIVLFVILSVVPTCLMTNINNVTRVIGQSGDSHVQLLVKIINKVVRLTNKPARQTNTPIEPAIHIIALECEKTLSVIEVPSDYLKDEENIESQIRDCILFDIVKREKFARLFIQRMSTNSDVHFSHFFVDYEIVLSVNKICRLLSFWQMQNQAQVDGTVLHTSTQIFDNLQKFIAPNTLWCGQGDIAETYWSLGTETKVDMCCREHDHCPIRLSANENLYGLVNKKSFTISLCDCDRNFRSCLFDVNSFYASQISWIFFNWLDSDCIHSSEQCLERGFPKRNKSSKPKKRCQKVFSIGKLTRNGMISSG